MLQDDNVLRCWRNLVDNLVSIHIALLHARGLIAAIVFPAPRTRVPIVIAPHAGCINDGKSLLMALVDQCLDGSHAHPALVATGVAPLLDGFKDWLRLVATKGIVHIDHEQRGAFAKSAACTITGGFKDGFIAVG